MLLYRIFASPLLLYHFCILCATMTGFSTSSSDNLDSHALNKVLVVVPFLMEPLVSAGSSLYEATANVLTRHPRNTIKRILEIEQATKGHLIRNGLNLIKRMSDGSNVPYPRQISSSPSPSGHLVATSSHAVTARTQPQLEFNLPPEDNSTEDIFEMTFTSTEPTVHGSKFLTWIEAHKYCSSLGGVLAKMSRTLLPRVINDALKFVDRNGFIELWTNNESARVFYVQGATTDNPQGFNKNETEKGTLPFYCQFEGDVPTTSSDPNTTPSSPETTPSSPETTPPSPETTPSSTSPMTSVSAVITEETHTSTSVPPTTSEPKCCPATAQRGLNWKSFCGDHKVTQKCPPPAQNGTAVWYCNGATGLWYPTAPDLSSCKSPEVIHLLKMIDFSDISGAYNYLSQAAAHAYAGGDIIAVADIIDNLTSTLDNKQNLTAEEWLGVVENVTESLTDTINSFLNSSERWTDIPEKERVEVANRLLTNVNKVGFQLAYAMNGSQHTVEKEHVFLQAIKEPRGSFTDRNLTLPLTVSSSRDVTMTLNSGFEVNLPMTEDNPGYTIALFTSLENMEEVLILTDRSLLKNSTSATEVNSPVLGLSLLENNTISFNLSNGMRFVVPRGYGSEAGHLVCAFWDVHRKTWSDEGCWEVPSNDSHHTTCACDHLTNFALLMDIHGVVSDFSVGHLQALTYITYVGCGISILLLAICVFLTTAIRQLWCIRNTIHRNLAFCLLVAEVLLISGLERTEDKTLCSIVAGTLHYFFLAAFCWMFLEAVFIYILLEKVFAQRRSYSERYYLFGYGFPLVIISISAGANPSGYGTSKHCWLSSENGMMWSFGTPVLIIVVVNFMALVFALRTAIVMAKKKTDDEAAARQWIYGSMTLVPLLGLTWGIGFLTWNNSGFGVASAYFFTILNSLQGSAIFLVQVAMNKKVRTLVLRKLSGSFRRVTPLFKSGTSNPKTASTTSGDSNGHQPVSSMNSGQSGDSGGSYRSRSTFCPDSPVALFNEVLRNTRSYELATAQQTNRIRDIVSYGPEGDGEIEYSAVILKVCDANSTGDSVI